MTLIEFLDPIVHEHTDGKVYYMIDVENVDNLLNSIDKIA